MPRTFTPHELLTFTWDDLALLDEADIAAFFVQNARLTDAHYPHRLETYLDGDYAKVGSRQATDWGK